MVKVSIIVPVYNATHYIKACADSIINQIYPDIECIFIDDCSPDNSILLIKEILKYYTGNIEFKIIYHEKNLGAAAARNLGVTKASGDYIYFLDSDDTIFPNCISSLVNFVNTYPNVDMVLGDMECEDPVMKKIFTIGDKKFPLFSNDPFWINDNFLINISVSPCNKLLRSELIRNNQLSFKENIVNEDVLWVFFLSKYVRSIAFCNTKTYYYNYNTASVTTSSENEEKRISSWIIVLNTYLENIDKNIKWIENLSLLKLSHHVRFYKVSEKYQDSFRRTNIEFLKSTITNKNVPFAFKSMYLMLLCPINFLQKVRFIWNKCLGLLYITSKWKDRIAIKKLIRSKFN